MTPEAIDCSNEKTNPGIRKIVKELTGEEAAPKTLKGDVWC